MILRNTISTLLNIGYIIWYKMHMAWLHMIDVELWIPSQFNPVNNDNTNTIDHNDDLVNDYIDSWYDEDSDKDKYNGPYCETP